MTTETVTEVVAESNISPLAKANTAESNVFIKWSTLFLLVIQSTLHCLAVHYTKVRPDPRPFLQTAVVVAAEVVKFLFSLTVIFCAKCSTVETVVKHLSEPVEMAKICGLSLAYTVQNNLVFYAMSNLNPAVFLIVQQLKLFFTAVCANLLLEQKFNGCQKLALLILAVGVSTVQLANAPKTGSSAALNTTYGLIAVVLASLLSGFACVYLEKMLKTTEASVWIRNLQLSITSIPIGVLMVLIEQRTRYLESPLGGYDWLVCVTVLLIASGGILVAITIKYADNILKSYATSLSIVLTTVLSVLFLNFHLNIWFLVGTAMVLASLALYLQQH